MTSDVRATARRLASGGWHVFPLVPNEKRPATEHGFHDASADPEAVDRWSASSTGYGIACEPSGLFVVDVDVVEGAEGPAFGAGVTAWFEMVDRYGDVETLEVVTGRGGLHIYWQAPEVPLGNSAGKLAAHVDTRGRGGYVVGPGSTVAGNVYEIMKRRPVAPCPRWLVDKLTTKRTSTTPSFTPERTSPYGRRALEAELGRVAMAREGVRNGVLNAAAFGLAQLVAGGELDGQEVADELERVALAAGLGEKEIASTIRSGFTAGVKQPRRAPHR